MSISSDPKPSGFRQNQKKSIFIHVGLHKCASTYLQRQVFPNITDVQYFREIPGLKNALKQFNQTKNLGGLTNLKKVLISTKARATLAQNVLISEEMLSGYFLGGYNNSKQIAQVLKDVFLNDFNVIIVIVIRRQADLLESGYKQSIQMYSGLSPIEYLNVHGRRDAKNFGLSAYPRAFNYWRIFNDFAGIFGTPNVRVLVKEKLDCDKTGFAIDLKNALGLSTCPGLPQVYENKGYSSFSVRLARFLNNTLPVDFQKKVAAKRKLVLAENRSLVKTLRLFALSLLDVRFILQEIVDANLSLKRKILSDNQRLEIQKATSDGNRKLDEYLNLGLGIYGYF